MGFIKRVYRILLSPRFTIIVFLALTLLITGAAMLDIEILQELNPQVNSTSVYSHQLFMGLSFLLLLIISLCTFRQFQRNYRNWKRQTGPWSKKLCFIGSPIFHLGLCIIIFGAFFDAFGGMTARIDLRAGESFVDLPDRYTSLEVKPIYFGGFNDFGLTIKDIKQTYHPDGVGTQAILDLTTQKQHGQVVLDRDTKETVGLKTLARSSYGYYAAYQITTPEGKSLPYTLGLATQRIDQKDQYDRNNFQQPETPYTLSVAYLPDADLSAEPYQLRSYEPKNPAILLTISSGGEELYTGPVLAGKSVTLKDGATFSFEGAIPYVMLEVKWILGTYLVSLGFILFMVGLVVYYLYRGALFTPIEAERGDSGGNS